MTACESATRPAAAPAASRVRALLPPAGPLRRYSLVSLVDATGTGLFLTVSVLFFTRFAGLSAGSVALGLSVAGLAAMIGAVPLGSLGDRFGHRRVWVILTVVQGAVFAAYPLVRTFPDSSRSLPLPRSPRWEGPRSGAPTCPGSRARRSEFARGPTTRPSATPAGRSAPWSPG